MVAIVGGADLGLGSASGQILGGQGQLGSASQGRSGEGVVVNAITGNLTLQRQDELLKGIGPDVRLIRTYNSQGSFNDDNGDNWRIGYSRKVHSLTGAANTAGSTIKRLSEDGADIIYTFDTLRGAYVTHKGAGAYDQLTFDTNTKQWTWKDGDTQTKEVYDSLKQGRLVQVRDPDGHSLTVGYNAAGFVSSIADSSGETVQIVYDSAAGKSNNIVEIRTLSAGATLTRVRYGYDVANRLTRVTVDLTPEDNSVADNKAYITNYTYDGTSKRLASISQSDGSLLQFSYTLVGTEHRVETVKDVRGADVRTTTFTYDTTARRTAITDPAQQVTVLTYDALNQLQSVISPATSGGQATTSFAYDAKGNVEAITDARGNTIRYEYDSNGNRTRETDELQNTVRRTFDTANRLLTETAYVATTADGTPSGGLTTRYVYGAAGQLRFTLSPEGRVTEYRYNALGQQVSTVSYVGNLYSVASLSDIQSPTEAQLVGWSANSTLGKTTRIDTSYDFRGQISKVTTFSAVDDLGNGLSDGTQSVVQYVYDQAGNLLQTISPRGVATTDTATDYLTTHTYDGLGRQMTTTDALGRLTTVVYDDANRKTVMTLASGLVTATSYDQAGNVVSVVRSGAEGALGGTTYAYNKLGQLVSQTNPNGTRQYFIYDSVGRKVGSIDGVGSLTEYAYNLSGQLIKTVRYTNAVSATTLASAATDATSLSLSIARPVAAMTDRIEHRLYDQAGRLNKTIDGAGAVTEHKYDGAGRLVETVAYSRMLTSTNLIALAGAGGEIASDDPDAIVASDAVNDRITRQFYSADGLLLATLDAEGYLAENLHDSAGQLTQTIKYANRVTGPVTSSAALSSIRPALATADQPTFYIYNAKSQLVGAVDAEGYLTETQYDLDGNKTAVIRFATSVSYSPGQTLAQVRPSASAEDQKQLMQYDALNRLVRSDSLPDGLVATYEYDSAGNLAKTTAALGAVEARTQLKRYDSLGRVTMELNGEGASALSALGSTPTQAAIDSVWSQHGQKYTYDAAGLRTSSVNALGAKTLYYYDADGRLTHTINALGEVVESTYSLFGDVTSTRRYGVRLASTTLATLSGGLAESALFNALSGISNPALDSVERFSYGTRGELRSKKDALDGDTLFTYNAFTEVISRNARLNAGGARLYENFLYDRRGFSVTDLRDTTHTGAVVAGQTIVVRRSYDAFGRLTSTVDARNNTWSTAYDRLGRTVVTSDPSTPARVTTYDAFGRVLTRQDALGKTTSFTYQTSDRSVTITSPEGVTTTTQKNRHGEVVSVTDGRGNTTSYTYDNNGQLKTVTSPAGVSSHAYDRAGRQVEVVEAGGTRTAYEYDVIGRVLTRTVDPTGLKLQTRTFYDAKGQAAWQQDSNGVWTQTTYDLKGQVASVVIDPVSVPAPASTQAALSFVSNPSGLNLRTSYTYDDSGKTLEVTEGAGTASQKLTRYRYDNLGRLVQESVDPNGLNITTLYAYDSNGNMVSKVDALGHVTRFVYDEKNQNTYTVDATGAVIKNEYDHEGRVVLSTAFATPISLIQPAPLGTSISAAEILSRLTLNSATDRTTRTVYDGDGKVRFRIGANNAVVGYTHDAAGNVVQTTRYATVAALPAGVLTVQALTGLLVSHASDRVEKTVYDAANRAIFHIDAVGYVTQSVYDSAGNVIKSVRYANALTGALSGNTSPLVVSAAPASGAYVLTNPSKDQIVRTIFDSVGRARFEVDGEGYLVEHRYDAQGREVERIHYASKRSVADGATESAIRALLPATPGAGDASHKRVYDSAGRASRTVNAEGVTTLHTYNALGNETETVVAFGTSDSSTTRRVFDRAGRMIEETLGYDPSSGSGATSRYTLDALGNRIQVIDPRGVELTETDSEWAVNTRASLPGGTRESFATLSADKRAFLRSLFTTDQQFDAIGRITSLIDPNKKSINTQYDSFGNAVKVTDQRGNVGYFYFDTQNKLVLQVDPERYATQTFYDAFGNVEKIVRYSGRVLGNLSESHPPVIGMVAANGGAYLLESASADQCTLIEHDKRNLQTKITDAQGTYETMGYDAFGNKVSFRNKVGGVFSYTYDRVGNVLRETQPITSLNAAGVAVAVAKTYQYDARGNIVRLTEAAGLPEQRVTVFQYDRLNRQTRKIHEAFSAFDPATQTSASVTPTEIQKYDRRGNLIETVDARGNRTLFYYDALNRQTAKVSPLGQLTVWQFNDGSKPVAELAYSVPVSFPTSAGGVPPMPAAGSSVRQKLFSYDGNNRLISTRVPDVTLGQVAPGASNFSIVSSDLLSQSIYDATGNEVQTIDPRGGSAISYYDRLGRKVLQVDAENYVTAWQYDANGNVTQQVQYATKLSLLASPSSDPAALIANLSSSPDNRVTQFSYDKLGRVSEKRVLNVSFGAVSASNGGLTSGTATALERFTYDGLGNVVSHTKAASATESFVTNYTYDSTGRVLSEKAPGYVDHQGVAVRPQTDYSYNGLGEIRTEIERGLNDSSEADDRVTRYAYTVGGRVASQTDPTGAQTQYRYDAAGNVTHKTLVGRRDADGAAYNDVTLYQYDALNQEIWTKDLSSGELRETRYNIYGEITGKRLNGGGAGGLWQETASYDEMGRVWLSNQGDGVYKAYLYDANGNATLEIKSAGANFASLTREQVLALPANETFITISQYDRRNQLTDTYQPKMSSTREKVAVEQFITQQVGIAFSGGNITLSPSTQVSGRVETASSAVGSGSVKGVVGISGSLTFVTVDSYSLSSRGSFSATLPNLAALGSGGVRIIVTPLVGGVAQTAVTRWFAANPGTATIDNVNLDVGDAVRVQVFKSTVAGDLALGDTVYSGLPAIKQAMLSATPHNGHLGTRHASLQQLVFNGLPSNATRMVLFSRPLGSSEVWKGTHLHRPLTGTFVLDWSSFAAGNYEFRAVAFDASGNSVNAQTGTMALTAQGAQSVQAPMRSGGGAGFSLMENNGVIHFMQQGANATSLTIRYRPAGGGAWTQRSVPPALVSGSVIPGWFWFDPASYGLSGAYEFVIEARDAYGILVNTANSSFTTWDASSIFEDLAGIKNFNTPVLNGAVAGNAVAGVGDTSIRLDTEVVAIDSYGIHTYNLNTHVKISPAQYPTRVVVSYNPGNNLGVLTGQTILAANQAEAVIRIAQQYGSYSYQFEGSVQTVTVYRQTPAGEVLVSSNQFTAATGATRTVHGQDTIDFNSQPLGTYRLYFMSRPLGSNHGWSTLSLVNTGSGFRLDWSGWARATYEFQYVAVDAYGNILNTQVGTMALQDAAPAVVQYAKSPAGGLVVMDPGGALQIIGQGSTAQQLTVLYRKQGSGEVWQKTVLTPSLVAGRHTPGWFQFNPAAYGLSGSYEYMLDARDASGISLNRVQGSFTTWNPNSVSSLKGYQNLPEVVHFTGQPSAAETFWVYYRPNGSTGSFTKVAVPKVGTGRFDWDAKGLVSDRTTNQHFEYRYEAYASGGLLLHSATGVLQLGLNPGMLSHVAVPPLDVEIRPTQANALKLALYYRTNGSTGPFSRVNLTRASEDQAFIWSARSLVPPGQMLSLDYYYTLADAAGNPIVSNDGSNLVHVNGVINLGANNTSTSLEWVVEGIAQVEAIIHRSQAHNAFGEVIKEIDGRNHVTNFTYNNLGLMTKKSDPETNVTLANGFVQRSRPTTSYHYDLAGRLVAVDDANGNRNTLSLLAGSGLNGEQAQVVAEFHADGGVKRSGYDVFGDARRVTDEIGRVTLQEFDAAGRLITLTRPQRAAGSASWIATALTETYEYDHAGNRIATTNALGKRERTYFDSLGRVTRNINFGGLTTAYDYSYMGAAILGVGGVAVGGYEKRSTLADGKFAIDRVDYFGRNTWRQDYGSHTFTYRYNHAGWLTEQSGSSGQRIVYDYYANGYLKNIQDVVTGARTEYEYDAEGNRTREAYTTTVNGQKTYYQVADVTYDELNRVTRILDPKADIRYEYDANGNRRLIWSSYHDGVSGSIARREYWYTYDSMNRFTMSMGQLSGARAVSAADNSVSIVKGAHGIQISYNSASERLSALHADGHLETYTYTADGYLEDTRINGVLRARRVNDALGRVTTYTEFDANAASNYSRSSTYNDANQLTQQVDWNVGKASKTTTYDYYDLDGTNNNAGPLSTSTLVDGATTVTTYYTYEWWDEAKQSAITISPHNATVRNWKSGYSNFAYDVNGHILQVKDEVGGRTLKYTTDAQGLVLTRNETAPGVNIHHSYYYLDGKRVGDVGNNGPESVSYAEELAARGDTRSRKDKYKNWTPISSADFDQNYQPITSTYPGASATSYTARTGDTLQSIAAAVWGNSSMWYLIADANGLNGSETLKAGQVLVIPNKVTNIHNNSNTYSVYDAGETLGDTSPTLPDAPPPPRKKKGCGGIAKIIVVVVAIAVAFYTAGLLLGAGGGISAMGVGASAAVGGAGAAGVAASVVGAAVGSIVSQGVAIGLGVQDKFSWGDVARSAISAGVTSGVGHLAKIGQLQLPGNALGQTMSRSAISSAATQGLAVATGLQEKFSWTSVAASAVGSGVGLGFERGLGGAQFGLGEWGGKVARGTLISTANAGTQSLIFGQKPNWGTIAADSFGSSLGSSFATEVVKTDQSAAEKSHASRSDRQWAKGAEDLARGSAELDELEARLKQGLDGSLLGKYRGQAYAAAEATDNAANGAVIAKTANNAEAGNSDGTVSTITVPQLAREELMCSPAESQNLIKSSNGPTQRVASAQPTGTIEATPPGSFEWGAVKSYVRTVTGDAIFPTSLTFAEERSPASRIRSLLGTNDTAKNVADIEAFRDTPVSGLGGVVNFGQLADYGEFGVAGLSLVAGGAGALKLFGKSDNLLDAVPSNNLSPSEFARSLQGSGNYPGIDTYRDITLRQGKIIYGGTPGQSEFYTTASALKRSDYSAQKLFDGVQVSPGDPTRIPVHPETGLYRPGVTAYEVTKDVPAAFGRTLANPQHGAGGLPQIVLEDFQSYLRPIYSIPLKK